MRILVLSLLRIGDVVLSAPVLRGLRERYPQAEIHLMINAQFSQIAPLIPYIDEIIPFERDRVQKGLGEATTPFFDSYERIAAFVDELNGRNYDLMINLTHSRLSGWLASLVDAGEKIGLTFDGTGRASFGSSWFRFLNNQVDAEGEEVFHYTDVFRFALGLDEEVHRTALIETAAGRAEAEHFIAGLGATGEDEDKSKSLNPSPILAVQALSSDVKKDWGLPRFASALEQFARVHPEAEIAVIGAPFERERLWPLIDGLRARGIKAHAAILSFEGAFSLLKRSRLLLSVDTSIKHLAGTARTPVVELCLGSGDFHRTGSYQSGSLIIQSREACAPCVHSKPCHRESQFCASRVPPELVAMVVAEAFAGRSFQLRAIAEEFKEEAGIFRVEAKQSGFWAAYSVLEPFTEESVGRWIDLASRKIWLLTAQASRDERVETGSEIRRLAGLLHVIHPGVSGIEWRHLFDDFERQSTSIEGRINGFKTGIRVLHGVYEDPRKMREFVRGLISFRERIRGSALMKSFRIALDAIIEDDISPAFTRFRRIVDAVTEIERRTVINLRIIRGLTAEMASRDQFDMSEGEQT